MDKRHKVCVNFDTKNDNTYINKDIVSNDLINQINKILAITNDLTNNISNDNIFNDNVFNDNIFHYFVIQKTFETNQYAIKIVLRFCNNDPIDILKDLFCDIIKDYNVFCYQYTNDKSAPNNDNPIKYLTKNKYLIDNYDNYNDINNISNISNIMWKSSIDSFNQTYPIYHNTIHHHVNDLINNSSNSKMNNFIGLGGESGYYLKANKSKFKNYQIYTNSPSIKNDNNANGIDCNLIDYDDLDFNLDNNHNGNDNDNTNNKNDHNDNDNDNNNLLLINIGRKGLKNLVHKINNISLLFRNIIYISCCEKTLNKDIDILCNCKGGNYKISNKIILDNIPTQKRYIISLSRIV